MGVYRYTLRTETKTIAGMVIGRFAFAYKEHFWSENGAYRRKVAVMESHAETARFKNRDLEYAIIGSFTDAADEPLAVLAISKTITSYSDNKLPGTVIGHIRKEGRSYIFTEV